MNYVGSKVNASIVLGTTSLSGYNFRGWSTDSAANAKITIAANGTASINANTTYYASYTYGITATLKTYNNKTSTKTGSAYMSYNGTKANGTINLGTTSLSGYTFRGWSTKTEANASITVQPNGNANIQANTTFYASYSYTVTATLKTYNNKTSSKTGTAYMNYVGSKVNASIALGTTSLSGYTFRGWSTNSAANAKITIAANGTASINANTTYYASYNYTVTATYKYYNGSAYTTTTASASAFMNYIGEKVGAKPTVPSVKTPSGWSNRGWSKETSSQGKVITPGPITANTIYYYSWSKAVKVTYSLNGGSGTAPSPETKTAYKDHAGKDTNPSFTMPSVSTTKTGYNFGGWNTSLNGSGTNYSVGQKVTISSSKTIYAKWSAKKVVVTFMRNTSSIDTTSTTQTFTYGVSGQSFSNKGWTKTGYTLSGWSENRNATSKQYDTLSGVADSWINSKSPSVTLYAVWKGNNYTMTFDNNYFSNNQWTDTTVTSKYKHYMTHFKSIQVVDDAESDCGGYVKVTMNSGAGGVYYNANKLTPGKTYTWRVTVRASSNKTIKMGQEQNGTGTVNITTTWQTFTKTFTANDNQYYAFVFYLSSGNWNNGDVLYIKSLEVMEGKPSHTTMSKTAGTKFGTLPTPSRTGYTFKGWFTTPTGGTQITSSSTVPTSARTYYAHWTANKYNIDYYTSAWNEARGNWDYKLIRTTSYYYGRTLTLDPNALSAPTGYDKNTLLYSGNVCRSDAQWEHPLSSSTFTVKAFNGRVNYNYYGKYYTIVTQVLTYKLDGTWTWVSEKRDSVRYSSKYVPSLNGLSQPYGHNFSGWWNTSADGFIVTGDREIHAEFRPWQHTITYNANGGYGAPGNQTKTFGYVLNISNQKPTRSNYNFVNWNTRADGSGTSYSPGQNYPPDQNGGTVTLYAQWVDATPPTVKVDEGSLLQCADSYLVNGEQHHADTYLRETIRASDSESGIRSIWFKIRADYYGFRYETTEYTSTLPISYNVGKDHADKYWIEVNVTNNAGIPSGTKIFGPYTFYGWQDRGLMNSVTPGTYVTGNDFYLDKNGEYLKNTWILTSGHLYWLNKDGTYTRRHYASASESDPNYMNNFTTTINGHDYRVRSYGSVVAYGQEYVNEKIESQDFVNKYKGWMRLYHPGGGYSWAYSKGSLGNGWGYHDFYYNNRYLRIGSDTYAFHKNGFMASDEWVNYNGAWYYARDWGGFLHNQSMYITRKDYSFDGDPKRTINAATYQFDSSGRCTNFYSYN